MYANEQTCHCQGIKIWSMENTPLKAELLSGLRRIVERLHALRLLEPDGETTRDVERDIQTKITQIESDCAPA